MEAQRRADAQELKQERRSEQRQREEERRADRQAAEDRVAQMETNHQAQKAALATAGQPYRTTASSYEV